MEKKGNSTFELIENVKMKNSVLKHALFYNVVTSVVDAITLQLPNVKFLKLDVELTQTICNAVINLITKKQEKLLVMTELYLAVILKLFELSPDEVIQIRNQIEYLENNNKIKRITLKKKIWRWVSGWIIRRLN